MLKNISAKALSTIVLILIVLYGFFKNWVKGIYAQLIEKTLSLLGFDSAKITSIMNEFAQTNKEVSGILGWIIYYPTYFLLHIAFIFLLFHKQKKTRNYLTIGLTGLIALSVGLALIGKVLELELIYNISYDAFQKLFGLPFILLFIEGGRILYYDIFEKPT
ncbi:MAG: hypothetical protein ABJ004_18860 [Cyclobacteriaceae bacterium]